MKTEIGQWDYCSEYLTIESARRNYCAFPIVSSALDTYPGKGKVDALQEVNSDWVVFGKAQFTVTAVSANTALGTVVPLNDLTFEAKPAENAAVSGWSLQPEGAAAVAQDGNVFTVSDVREDCTLVVEFRQRVPATVVFSTPEGASQPMQRGYVGEEMALTAPEAGMCSSILNLKCYRLLVSPDAAEQEMSEMVHVPDLILPPVDGPIRLAGAMFRILHTPGHSSGHICAVTPDNVCYTGDALMSQALLDAKLPYGLSIQLAMESRERLQELEDCDFFIMAHKGVCTGREIGPLIDANQELVRRRAGEIRDLITEPMDFSQICRAVCTRFSLLTRRPRRALYYERNIRLFVEYLMDQGELGMETRQGTAFYLPSKKI